MAGSINPYQPPADVAPVLPRVFPIDLSPGDVRRLKLGLWLAVVGIGLIVATVAMFACEQPHPSSLKATIGWVLTGIVWVAFLFQAAAGITFATIRTFGRRLTLLAGTGCLVIAAMALIREFELPRIKVCVVASAQMLAILGFACYLHGVMVKLEQPNLRRLSKWVIAASATALVLAALVIMLELSRWQFVPRGQVVRLYGLVSDPLLIGMFMTQLGAVIDHGLLLKRFLARLWQHRSPQSL